MKNKQGRAAMMPIEINAFLFPGILFKNPSAYAGAPDLLDARGLRLFPDSKECLRVE